MRKLLPGNSKEVHTFVMEYHKVRMQMSQQLARDQANVHFHTKGTLARDKANVHSKISNWAMFFFDLFSCVFVYVCVKCRKVVLDGKNP